MVQYAVMSDFNGTGFVPIQSAVVTAIPPFWSLLLFVFWITINAASYFAIAKLTGKKRFFHTFTATSFVMFLAGLIIAAQNTAAITFLEGYWVGFYILMTVVGYVLLEKYK